MVGDGKEHICSGCHEVIATHEPEAYQRGAFYYHSKAHEGRHASRNGNAFHKLESGHSLEGFRELAVRP